MSTFSHHEPCPQCGSKDNLAVYSDGHKFCFGCKYYRPGKENIHQVFSQLPSSPPKNKDYPHDVTNNIPTIPLKWLLSCGITFGDTQQFGIEWSPFREMVVWKIYNPEGTTLGWQGRCFSALAKTKYYISGDIHRDICILGEQKSTTIVLVEDYISAIRVSSHLPCMPLFSCTINLEALQALSKQFSTIIVWLDADKLDNARKIGLNASLLGLQHHILYTPKDPKNYSNSEIKQYLEIFL